MINYQSKKIIRPLFDLREKHYAYVGSLSDYSKSQKLGQELKESHAWGVVYNSVRHQGGECVAIFRPPAIQHPVTQTKHLKYKWNGTKIDYFYEINQNTLQTVP